MMLTVSRPSLLQNTGEISSFNKTIYIWKAMNKMYSSWINDSNSDQVLYSCGLDGIPDIQVPEVENNF